MVRVDVGMSVVTNVCQVVIKSKCFCYSVMNNWHWRLLVLIFGIYLRSGFGDDWNLQVLL